MEQRKFFPMSIGQILDNTFKLYRQNFVKFIVIVAIIQVPLTLIGTWLQQSILPLSESGEFQEPAVENIVGGFLVIIFITVLAMVWSSAALVRGVSDSYLNKVTSVGNAYRTVLPKLLTIIIASILIIIVVAFGFILLIVPGIIFTLWYLLTTQAIVIENVSAVQGMKRSKALVSGSLGKVFGVNFLVQLIIIVISWVISTSGVFIARSLASEPEKMIMISQIVEMIKNILITPIGAIALILLYYDLRIRKEGFDLEMLARDMSIEGVGQDGPNMGE